jgi:ParB family chromosome partitioning protein
VRSGAEARERGIAVNQRRGLGRGLGALIPTSTVPEDDVAPIVTVDAEHPAQAPAAPLEEVAGARYAELDLDDIAPNPRQPRTVFDEEALAELVHSIREIGLLQPVVVRPVPGAGQAGPHYELVAGERRWRAAREAGLTAIPSIVRETADDVLLRDALLENLHRSQLNALEEAAAYQQLLDDFGCTQEELAARIGRSRPQVSNTLRLMRLPAPVQRRVAAGVLSAGHARALLALDDPEAMDRLATRIVAEGLSVRATEEIVAVGEADGRERARVSRPRRPIAPGLTEIADRLSDRLETRVRIQAGASKGKISIEFATLEDLRRIVDAIEHD